MWSVWAYRSGNYKTFTMLDFFRTVALNELNYYHPEQTLEALRHRVNRKINRLQHQFPQARAGYKPLREELLRLGVTPQTTYLYMRGHDLHDGIVAPMLSGVCEALRREREREIRQLAEHNVQMQNELAAYQHATAPIEEMLRKHTDYDQSPEYRRVQEDVRQLLVLVDKSLNSDILTLQNDEVKALKNQS